MYMLLINSHYSHDGIADSRGLIITEVGTPLMALSIAPFED
jgi:hypothetical protein